MIGRADQGWGISRPRRSTTRLIGASDRRLFFAKTKGSVTASPVPVLSETPHASDVESRTRTKDLISGKLLNPEENLCNIALR